MSNYEFHYPKGQEIAVRPGTRPVAFEQYLDKAFVARGIRCIARREEQGMVTVQVSCASSEDDLAFQLWFAPAMEFYRCISPIADADREAARG